MTTEQDRFLTDEQLKSSDSEFKNMQKAWYEKTYGVQTQEATTEANKRIAELESEVAELKDTAEEWKTQSQDAWLKIAELQASNNHLREALEYVKSYSTNSQATTKINQALSKTPAQSLQALKEVK